ncbi:MAG TPA: RNA-binding cell elongation regulator Jag/EloR [Thermomicrobiaceae bacterium]|nr:RNA-binding cell elongation regulator Jag/EloR [Thermomicrobiaceae bacterium]
MRSVEIAARSVDEAVRLALEQLDVTIEQATVEVLMDTSDQSDGEALVRVTAGNGSSDAPRGPIRTPISRQPRATLPPPPDKRADPALEQETKQIVSELLTSMGFNCNVVAVDNPSAIEVEPDEPPTVFIDVHGRDLGMLIGRRGENLAQLQYMVNVLVNRQVPTWTRVIIDIEGYRIRREESLVNLANRVARQVARNRRPISLEPMPPNERRIVHVTLRNDSFVKTQSSGEGALRRVTIFPK